VLCGVALLILAATAEAVMSVSKKPCWQTTGASAVFALVLTPDRREEPLPFVGKDRRKADVASVDQTQGEIALAA
jgi:hypothetical protein